MSEVESRLAALGLSLPPPKLPVANYLGTKSSGSLLFVAGRVSKTRGQVSTTVSAEAAKLAARNTMPDLLAIIKADINDLDAISSILKLQGFVNSVPDLLDNPRLSTGPLTCSSPFMASLEDMRGPPRARHNCLTGRAFSWT